LILQGLEEFRQHLGGELTVTMLKDVGTGFEVNEVYPDAVAQAINILLRRNRAA
jgi:3-dehydroquinate synthase